MNWQNIVNILVGIWLIISAFLNLSASANLWNYLIMGVIVLILSFLPAKKKEEPQTPQENAPTTTQ